MSCNDKLEVLKELLFKKISKSCNDCKYASFNGLGNYLGKCWNKNSDNFNHSLSLYRGCKNHSEIEELIERGIL